MPLVDKEARNKYNREYVQGRLKSDPEFRDAYYKRVRRNDNKRKDQARALVYEFRSNGCIACGETEECVLAAHHLDPNKKDFGIGIGLRSGVSLEKMKSELSKCVCLCHNCHAKVHAGKLEVHAGVT